MVIPNNLPQYSQDGPPATLGPNFYEIIIVKNNGTNTIALTPQLVSRFCARLGKDRVAVLHSRLDPAARHEQWLRIARGPQSSIWSVGIGFSMISA